MSTQTSPIQRFISEQGFLLLDGGLATELESRGYDLSTSLWSAEMLDKDPAAIKRVHYDYLIAGADCIISASYQASVEGFISVGKSKRESESLILKSVDLAIGAREEFLNEIKQGKDLIRPLVAGSIGPYGAMLADGSEYRGDYGVSKRELQRYHEPRWKLLTDSQVDIIACETIPNFEEAEVLLSLINETPDIFTWVSFSCMDGEKISDGTPIRECAALFADCERVVAIGVNCTSPEYITSLIEEVHSIVPAKEVVVYPNSGEIYDSSSKKWLGEREHLNSKMDATEWHRAGANIIGGCCRIGPEDINLMLKAFV